MQIVLQATHGIVSGEPTFFKRAFGDTAADYERILMMPHDFIFNRDWHENADPQDRLGQFQADYGLLDGQERAELVALLSSCDPRAFGALGGKATTAVVKRVLVHYVPLGKDELQDIWRQQRAMRGRGRPRDIGPPEDELVEDAGLDSEDDNMPGKGERAAA